MVRLERHRVAVDPHLDAGGRGIQDRAAHPVAHDATVPAHLVQLPVEEGDVGVLPQVAALAVAHDADPGVLVLASHLGVVVLVPVEAGGDGHVALGRLDLLDVCRVAPEDLLALPAVERVGDGARAGLRRREPLALPLELEQVEPRGAHDHVIPQSGGPAAPGAGLRPDELGVARGEDRAHGEPVVHVPAVLEVAPDARGLLEADVARHDVRVPVEVVGVVHVVSSRPRRARRR
jgi:hypothetical protein